MTATLDARLMLHGSVVHGLIGLFEEIYIYILYRFSYSNIYMTLEIVSTDVQRCLSVYGVMAVVFFFWTVGQLV